MVREGCGVVPWHVDIKKGEVLGRWKNIEVDKSLGPDGFYPQLQREASDEISEVLTEIFVSSAITAKVPEDWRLTNVILYKKDVGISGVFVFDEANHGEDSEGLMCLCVGGIISHKPDNIFEEVSKMTHEGRSVDVVGGNFCKAMTQDARRRLIQNTKAQRLNRLDPTLATEDRERWWSVSF